MNHKDPNQQPPEAYCSKDTSAAAGIYPVLLPPAVAERSYQQEEVPPSEETKSKGDGFWRGCCAGLCCYCCLDLCF